MTDDRVARGGFVPPYLLRSIARSGDPGTAALCQDTLRADASFRDMRRTEGSRAGLSAHTATPVVAEPRARLAGARRRGWHPAAWHAGPRARRPGDR